MGHTLLEIHEMGTKSAVVVAGVLAVVGLAVGFMPQTDAAPAEVFTTANAETYAVDNGHSSVVFGVSYMGVTNFYGRFNKVSGEYSIDPENPSASSLDISVDAESVDSNNEGRDKHLRGADFFSAKEFPQIRFKATSFEAGDDGSMNVTGELTLRGKTQTETATLVWMGEMDDPRGMVRSGFEAELVIDRSDYGVNYGVESGALGDEVTLTIGITGTR
ncbi:MAG: YceI family protein [Phycisphaerales bacterium]